MIHGSASSRMPRHVASAALVLQVFFWLTSALALADGPTPRPGFEYGHGYADGPTDSIELRTLNPIVSQSLSPSYPIRDDFTFQIVAYHTGFTWSTYLESANPVVVKSEFIGSQNGILGAGWYLNPGRVWTDIKVGTTPAGCNNLRYAFVSAQGAISYINEDSLVTSDGSRLLFSDTNSPQVANPCDGVPDKYLSQGSSYGNKQRFFDLDTQTGAITQIKDSLGNSITYTYMDPNDFLAIEPTATPSQYDFNRSHYVHPGSGEIATEVILAPKTAIDSLGRQIDFIYELLPGHAKFLLTELQVDTPNGRSSYRLHYQVRTVSDEPAGWPNWTLGPATMSLLVKVELPPADEEHTSLSYNFDYNELGELVEVRYPSGAMTTYDWSNINVKKLGDTSLMGTIYNRGVTTRTETSVVGARAWSYEKAWYPADIEERERTIVTDPVGNETEYRFSNKYTGRFGFLTTTKNYKGKAPRWSTSASMAQYQTPYNGVLTRVSSSFYSRRWYGEYSDMHPIKRVSLVTFYDDDLMTSGTRTYNNPDQPGSWDIGNIDAEAESIDEIEGPGYDEWEDSLTNLASQAPGFARFAVGAYYQDSQYGSTVYDRIDHGPMIGWEKTIEAGNLVGEPRTITGNYEVGKLEYGLEPSRIIEQGGKKSRTDYPASQFMCPFGPPTAIRRADPNSPEFRDIPWEEWDDYEELLCEPHENDVTEKVEESPTDIDISYSGGDISSPESVEYTETVTRAYGDTQTRTLGELDWYDTDTDVGILGIPNAERDSAGFQVAMSYDDIGRLVAITPSETAGLGMTELPTTYSYNELTDEYEDRGGFDVSHTYSTKVTESRGEYLQPSYEVAKSYYDGQGRVIKEERETADGGLVYRLRTYDAVGAITCESQWHGYPSELLSCEEIGGTTYDYEDSDGHHDPFNRPLLVTRPDGSETEFEYFGLNTKTTVKGINGDPNMSATTIVYRDYKNRVRVVDAPEGADAIYSYDHLGNLLTVRLVGQVAFDPNALNTNRFAVTNSGGQQRTFTYDTIGHLRTSIHPEHGPDGYGTTTYSEYDSRGNLRSMYNPDGSHFKYSYDAAGRQAKVEVKPSGGTEFKVVSELLYQNDPNGTGYGPYALGKLRTEKSYASDGNTIVSVREQVYGGLSGRVSQEKQRIGNSWGTDPNDVVVSSITYNTSGLPSELIYPSVVGSSRVPTRLTYEYAHGYLVGLQSNRQTSDPNVMGDLISDITYHDSGVPETITYSNGVVETWEVDVSSRPGRIGVIKDTTELWDSGVYEYDGASNIIGIGDQVYTYDLIGRLRASTTLSPVDPNIMHEQDYDYDIYGNMTERNGAAGEEGTQVFEMDPNNTNRVDVLNPELQDLDYEYDALGAVTNDGLHAFDWDLMGRLTDVLTVDSSLALAGYSYDDRNYRVDRETDEGHRRTLYIRDSNGQVLTEFAYPSSSIEPHWRKDYIYALGRHIAAVENIAPNTPTGIESDASDPNAQNDFVELSWLSVSDPDLYGYDVWRRSNPNDPNAYSLLTWESPDAASPYSDANVSEGSTYWYKLSAVDTAGLASQLTSPVRVMVGDQYNPPVPGSFDVQFVPQSKAQATWSSVTDTNDQSDILGYNLYRKVNSGSWPSTPRNGSVPISGTSYMDTGLFDCNTYYYRLKAVDAGGRESSYTSIKSITLSGQGCGGGGGGSAALVPPKSSDYRAIGQQSEEVTYGIVYYHVDHLGTPRVITDSEGEVVATAALFPFGEAVPGSTSAGNTHWFTGHERDPITYHDYALARNYDPVSGRFSGTDPITVRFLVPGQNSLYVYAFDDPLTLVDPDGRDAESRACKWKAGVEVGIGLGTSIVTVESIVGLVIGGAATGVGLVSWTQCEEARVEREKAREIVDDCLEHGERKKCQEAIGACAKLGFEECKKVSDKMEEIDCKEGRLPGCPAPEEPDSCEGGVAPLMQCIRGDSLAPMRP